MGSRHRVLAALFSLLFAAVLSSAARAGVVPVSRLSRVFIEAETSLDSFDTSDEFTTLGLYDKTLSASVPGAGGGDTSGTASQLSLFGPASSSARRSERHRESWLRSTPSRGSQSARLSISSTSSAKASRCD